MRNRKAFLLTLGIILLVGVKNSESSKNKGYHGKDNRRRQDTMSIEDKELTDDKEHVSSREEGSLEIGGSVEEPSKEVLDTKGEVHEVDDRQLGSGVYPDYRDTHNRYHIPPLPWSYGPPQQTRLHQMYEYQSTRPKWPVIGSMSNPTPKPPQMKPQPGFVGASSNRPGRPGGYPDTGGSPSFGIQSTQGNSPPPNSGAGPYPYPSYPPPQGQGQQHQTSSLYPPPPPGYFQQQQQGGSNNRPQFTTQQQPQHPQYYPPPPPPPNYYYPPQQQYYGQNYRPGQQYYGQGQYHGQGQYYAPPPPPPSGQQYPGQQQYYVQGQQGGRYPQGQGQYYGQQQYYYPPPPPSYYPPYRPPQTGNSPYPPSQPPPPPYYPSGQTQIYNPQQQGQQGDRYPAPPLYNPYQPQAPYPSPPQWGYRPPSGVRGSSSSPSSSGSRPYPAWAQGQMYYPEYPSRYHPELPPWVYQGPKRKGQQGVNKDSTESEPPESEIVDVDQNEE